MLEEMKRKAKVQALKHLVSQMHKRRFAEGSEDEEKSESPAEAMRESLGMSGEDLLEGSSLKPMHHDDMDDGESESEASGDMDDEDDFNARKKSFMRGRKIGSGKPVVSKTVIAIGVPKKKGRG